MSETPGGMDLHVRRWRRVCEWGLMGGGEAAVGCYSRRYAHLARSGCLVAGSLRWKGVPKPTDDNWFHLAPRST